MYFPGDPLFAQDPIFNAAGAPATGSSRPSTSRTQPEWVNAYRWDVVLARTPFEDASRHAATDRRAVLLHRVPWPDGPAVAEPGSEGAIVLHGAVYNGEGAPVPDALIETWQTDPAPPARGFGRCPTDGGGPREIVTRKPAAAGGEAPHVAVAVFARGLLTASRRGSTSATSPRPTPPTRCCQGSTTAVDADRRSGRRRLPIRHPPPRRP